MAESNQNRPPIITIMGHVDHGKTTLMDFIQSSTIAAREVGGITQTIRAFSVVHQGKPLTFIDTPGHEAFSKMRERGSNISDVILLVVAADDGVKPQTKEVIQLALKNEIPLVVAINKVDLPNADVNRIRVELANNGVLLEGWGGNTINVEISAKTGQGVSNLLDMLLLVSELEDLKDDTKLNEAIVLESYMSKAAGPESLVIIKSGEIEVGDFVRGDDFYGKIRAIIDDKHERIQKATVSMPVRILGLEKVLQTGEGIVFDPKKENLDEKIVVLEEKQAEVIAKEVESTVHKTQLDLLDELLKQSDATAKKPKLNIVLKADFIGSIEAIQSAFEKNKNENVDIEVIRSGTGEVNESDVIYAKSTKSVVIGFNVSTPTRIKSMAKKEKVIIMPYSIIYELIDDVVTAAESLIPAEIIEIPIGSVDVIDVFTLSNKSVVAGSIVKDGKVVKGYNCYVLRDGDRVLDGKIISLRHLKNEVREVQKGTECGIIVNSTFEFLKGDKIFCIKIEKS